MNISDFQYQIIPFFKRPIFHFRHLRTLVKMKKKTFNRNVYTWSTVWTTVLFWDLHFFHLELHFFWFFCSLQQAVNSSQCGNSSILLSLRFYVKSDLAILGAQKGQFWSFWSSLRNFHICWKRKRFPKLLFELSKRKSGSFFLICCYFILFIEVLLWYTPCHGKN